MSSKLFSLAIAASAVMLGSCKDGVGPSVPIAVIDGDGQRTIPLGQVPRPIVVVARDGQGKPLPGVLIRWSGAGTKFALDTSRTDANGRAQAIWILGQTAGQYTGQASADSISATVAFGASAEAGSLTLSMVPDTIRFSSIGDTMRVRIRVRSGALDTLIDPIQIGGTGTSSGVAHTGKPGFVILALKNGTDNMRALYGEIPVPFTVIVSQVAKSYGVVRVGATHGGDTVTIAPDSTVTMSLVPVDANGHAVAAPLPTNVSWSSSNSSVVSMSGDQARSITEGRATITAQYNGGSHSAVLHVWTLRPTAISAISGMSCALVEGGAMACWGFRTPWSNSSLNQALAPELRGGPAFTKLSGADGSLCGLTATRTAYCWGGNSSGQLGRGDRVTPITAPGLVQTPLAFDTINVKGSMTCGLSGGKAYCWGSGYGGALGTGLYDNEYAPVAVSGGFTFKQISVGGGFACGLTSEGRAYCWGQNRYGQLGSPRDPCAATPTGDLTTSGLHCSTVPIEVSGNHRFSQITAGSGVACGIRTDGPLYCWGINVNGLLGSTTMPTAISSFSEVPLAVETTVRFKSVVMEQYFACGIDTSSAAWCWGEPGGLGRLGNGSTSGLQRTPVQVSGGLSFQSLALGISHACGLTTTSVVYCWGWGGAGSLGYGGTANSSVPRKVALQR